MSELPDGIPAAEPPTPRDSAAGLVLRRDSHGRQTVLLGLRSRKSRFMPGHLAFPGGAVDPEDREAAQDLGAGAAFAQCVSREIVEEVGLSIPATEWIDAGRRLTPSMFPVRFDNQFFVAVAPEGWQVPDVLPSPEELERLEFVDPAQVLDDWSAGRARLAPPVMPLLRGLVEYGELAAPDLAARLAEINTQEQRAPRIEFSPDIWMVPVRTATLPPATHTNVWMPGVGKFVLIDPGCGDPAEQAMLLEVVERRRAAGGSPLAVLLTHGHIDHVAGARAIARALNVPLRAHASVLETLRPDDGDGATPVMTPIADGECIDLEGLILEAKLTPGHAPGHLVFHVKERGIVLAGDLLSGISTILIDPETGDMGDYMESLALLDSLGCRQLCPGHGPPVPGKALGKLIQHRRDRESRILKQLSAEPIELSVLAKVAYAEIPQMPAVLTQRQALSHLILLERKGRARRLDAEGLSWAEQTTGSEIERILRAQLDPVFFELRDESHKHAGHAGATSGGGHYRVKIASAAFEGLSLLERHRCINDALRDMFGERIHALALRTLTPAEWNPS